VPLAIYVASLNGAVAYWDTGEVQTVPWIFGIMHPTGFPAFTLLGGLFAHVFAAGAVSWRMALFSALAASGSAWLVARICRELDAHPWIAAASAWVFAFGEIAWVRGTRAEVHTLALFFAMSALYASVRWYRSGDARMLVGGAAAWGLGMATHPITALLAPAFAAIFFARMRTATVRSIALALLTIVCGLALYAYLPVRSAMVTAERLDPTSALGLPPGKAFWDNNHPASLAGFKREVTGEDFSTGGAFRAMAQPETYVSQGPVFFEKLLHEITPLCALLALLGIIGLLRRDRWLAAALLLAFAGPTAFAFAFRVEADPDRYYLISYAVSMVLAGYGASAIAKVLPAFERGTTALLMLMAIALLVVNRGTFDQPHQSGAQAVIETAVEKTPDNAVLIAPWLYATPLAYAAYVEHRLGHRILDCAWLADDAAMVPRWIKTRPVYVVGQLFGEVPGYRTVQIPGSPDLFKIVKN
jgi:4-amino-4-deoxy-L-arabinose transferase-like glycosyltransferase